ncbi:MAG: AMP-binding protein, partial [Phycisphaerales bacterium]|nr:AMP-binding protein [Phycisphaerales bacterium]
LREHRPTVFVGIPSMYNALLRSKSATPEDFASLRLPVSGGEPLPREVADRFHERFGVRILEGYGLTETSPVASVCLPEEWRRGSVGRALPGVRIRIMENGTELPPGSDGEIRLEGPNIMRGYYRLPEETATAFDARGAFRTGDIGRLDLDGHLYITGRLKEMMIVGGENVFPREIEEVLNQHPSVADAGVTSRVDPVRGEVPIAFVELAEGCDFDETSILEHCRANLAGYKVPREIRDVEALPRNPTGKILRRALKDL